MKIRIQFITRNLKDGSLQERQRTIETQVEPGVAPVKAANAAVEKELPSLFEKFNTDPRFVEIKAVFIEDRSEAYKMWAPKTMRGWGEINYTGV